MFTQLIARAYDAYYLTNPFKDFVFDSEYVIRNIEGLGPVNASINSVTMMNESGTVILGTHDNQRNVVITVEFAPNYSSNSTVTDLRRKISEFFYPRRVLELQFTTSMGVMVVSGTVESITTNIFAKDPQVVISMICPDPYFRLQHEIPTAVVVADVSLYYFSHRYSGSSMTGFEFEFEVAKDYTGSLGIVAHPRRDDDIQKYSRQMVANYQFKAGDLVKFSSVRGDKYAKLIRGGAEINLLGYIVGSLSGMKIYPDLNYFYIHNSSVGAYTPGKMKMTYVKAYDGI